MPPLSEIPPEKRKKAEELLKAGKPVEEVAKETDIAASLVAAIKSKLVREPSGKGEGQGEPGEGGISTEVVLGEPYQRFCYIIDTALGRRETAKAKIIKDLVKDNPRLYMNPQGMANLLQGLGVNPFVIPLIINHSFGGDSGISVAQYLQPQPQFGGGQYSTTMPVYLINPQTGHVEAKSVGGAGGGAVPPVIIVQPQPQFPFFPFGNFVPEPIYKRDKDGKVMMDEKTGQPVIEGFKSPNPIEQFSKLHAIMEEEAKSHAPDVQPYADKINELKEENKTLRKDLEKVKDELHKKELEVRDKKISDLEERVKSLEAAKKTSAPGKYASDDAALIDRVIEVMQGKLPGTEDIKGIIQEMKKPAAPESPEFKYTPEERRRKAEEIEQRLEAAGEVKELQDQILAMTA